jgi:hypothetical protein
MSADHDAPVPTPPAEPPAPVPSQRRRHLAALLGSTGLLATTALLAAVEPKLPRYVGD